MTLSHPHDWAGTSSLTATGDTADLTGLMALVDLEADSLPAVHDSPVGARRVKALSSLIRRGDAHAQDPLDLCRADDEARRGRPTVRRDRIRLHLHASLTDLLGISDAAGSGQAAGGEVGTVERLGPLTLARLKDWIGHSRVSVVPVLDLADDPWTPRHDPPPRTVERVVQRDGGCVFPGCGRDARSGDLDHIVPWPRGATRPDNLAPLCRRHHRAKTAGVWSYERLGNDYLWSGPHGETVFVHRGACVRLDPADRPTARSQAPPARNPSSDRPPDRSAIVASNSRSRSTP